MSGPIFVSHSSRDFAEVKRLVDALETRGFRCWLSERDVVPGTNYADAIVDTIIESAAMLLVFTANANASDEVKKEVALANQRRIPIVPVRLTDVLPTKAFALELVTRNWIDFFADWNAGLNRLSDTLAAISKTTQIRPVRPRLPPPPPKSNMAPLIGGVAAAIVVAAIAAFFLLRPVPVPPVPTPTPTIALASPTPTVPAPTPAASPTASPSPPAPIPVPATPTPAPTLPAPSPTPSAILTTPAPITAPTLAPRTPAPTQTPPAPTPTLAPPVPTPTQAPPSPTPTQSAPTLTPSEAPPAPMPTQASSTPTPTPSPPAPTPTQAAPAPAPNQAPPPPTPIQAPPAPTPSQAPPAPTPTEAPPPAPTPTPTPPTPATTQAGEAPVKPAAASGVAVGPPPAVAANDPGGDLFKECDHCPEMVVIPAGAAVLGTPADEPGRQPNEAPPHEVTIAKPFAIGRYAVTFQEWDACLAEGGCKHPLGDYGMGKGRRPALFISVDDAKTFLAYLSKATGQTYRLPSEAEWEYAARACLKPNCKPQPFWFGAITPDVAVYDSRYAYDGSPKGSQPPKSQPVDFGKPNAFGLFNALGNVGEWTADCYNPKPSAAPSNGAASASGDCSEHAIRGGSWADKPDALRAGARQHDLVDEQSERVGIRVVRPLSP